MSLLKIIKAQLGLSATATQNFTLTAENADGTMKLARGNAGATSQDILTVASDGTVSAGVQPTTGVRSLALATMQKFADEFGSSLAASGFQKLPSGLIIQWGNTATTGGSATVTLPTTYPNAHLIAIASENNASGWTASNLTVYGVYSRTVSQFTIKNLAWTGSAFTLSAGNASWISVGY